MHPSRWFGLLAAGALCLAGGVALTACGSASSHLAISGCSQPNYVGVGAVPDVLPANGRAMAVVTVQHMDLCNPVVDSPATLSLHGVCGTLSALSGVTGSDGTFVVTYRAGLKAGKCNIAPKPYGFPATIKQEAPAHYVPPTSATIGTGPTTTTQVGASG